MPIFPIEPCPSMEPCRGRGGRCHVNWSLIQYHSIVLSLSCSASIPRWESLKSPPYSYLINGSSVGTFSSVTAQILYFKPEKLDVARGLEGAEWNRLVAPAQRDRSVPAENIIPQARNPLTNANITKSIEPRKRVFVSVNTDSRASVQSEAASPKQELDPVPSATVQQQACLLEFKGSLKDSDVPTAAAAPLVSRSTPFELGIPRDQGRDSQDDAPAKVPSRTTLMAQSNVAADSGTSAQPTRIAVSAESFIPRIEVAAAQKYLDLQQLRRDVTASAPGSERVKINRSIREIKDAAYRPGRLTNNYCDVDGNSIGMVQVGNKGDVPRGCIPIGATDAVSSITFDFVERRAQTIPGRDARREIIDEMNLALRFTAIISEAGCDVLEKLAKQIVKSAPHRFGIRLQRGREESVPKTEIKRILRSRKTFDTIIGEIPAHISTNGKVELHTIVAPMRLVTVDELSFPQSKERHRIFTQFSRSPKKWVLRTSNELNEAVKNGFERLAQVLNRIFE